jgi:hypothetical protein
MIIKRLVREFEFCFGGGSALTTRRPRYTFFAILCLAFLMVTLLRFSAWWPTAWFGDDLRDYLIFRDSRVSQMPWHVILATDFDKWRPIFAVVMTSAYSIFGDKLQYYMYFNVLINTVAGLIFFQLALLISARNWIVSAVVAVTFISSRFALYQITQVTGLIEALSLCLFLGSLFALVFSFKIFLQNRADRWRWFSLFLLFLTIHSHERYISILPAWCLCFAIGPGLNLHRRMVFISGTCLIGVFNFFMKVRWFGIPFFVGTGGQKFDFDFGRTILQAKDLLVSIFGFNDGQPYLIGARSVELVWIYWILPVAMFCIWFWFVVGHIIDSLRAGPFYRLWLPLLLAACLLFVSLPALLTIRLEQRWLLEPFGLVLLLLCWGISASAFGIGLSKRTLGVLVFCTSSFFVDSELARTFDRVFFVSAGKAASQAHLSLLNNDPRPMVIEAGPPLCSWTLLNGDFFRFYEGRRRELYCIYKGMPAKVLPPNAATFTYNPSEGFVPGKVSQ